MSDGAGPAKGNATPSSKRDSTSPPRCMSEECQNQEYQLTVKVRKKETEEEEKKENNNN
jgi:hypothetical protein